MTKFILKLFVKNYQDTKNDQVRESYGNLSSIIGLIINFLLFVIKFLVGISTNLVSITADGFNNLSDSFSNIISIISFKLANKPPDKDHPYGHDRIEYIASSIISFIILFIGFEIGFSSVEKIINQTESTFSKYIIIVSVISIVLKIFIYFFNKQLSKMINSTILEAISKDALGDIMSTSVVLISAVIFYYTNYNLDGFIGILVAILIIKSAISLILTSFDELIGKACPTQLKIDVLNAVRNADKILGVHDILAHKYGNKYFFSLHAEIDAKMSAIEAHDIIDNIERQISKDFGISLIIHMDPVDLDNELCKEYIKLINDHLTKIDERINMHDFRIVSGPTHDNLVFDIEKPYDLKIDDEEITTSLEKVIKTISQKDTYLVITYDLIY